MHFSNKCSRHWPGRDSKRNKGQNIYDSSQRLRLRRCYGDIAFRESLHNTHIRNIEENQQELQLGGTNQFLFVADEQIVAPWVIVLSALVGSYRVSGKNYSES
jgi:hypothetical protein